MTKTSTLILYGLAHVSHSNIVLYITLLLLLLQNSLLYIYTDYKNSTNC